MSVPFFLQVKSRLGVRRRLPMRQVTNVSWKEVRYGGFADFTIETSALFTELTSIVATDIVEVYVGGTALVNLRYRGEVGARRRQLADTRLLTITGYGRMLRAGAHVVQKRYLKYGGYDDALQFRDLAADAVQPLEPGLTVRVTPIGLGVEQFDAYGKATKEAFDQLTDLTSNRAVWGVDVVTDGADAEAGHDRLYFQPFSGKTDWGVPAAARKTTGAESEEDATKVCNALYLTGGDPKFPNMLYNGGFDRPVFAGGDQGNLLLSPGFEDRAHWTLAGGASYKTTGLSEGPSFSGDDMVETDTAGESLEQTSASGTITAGHDISYAAHVRRESGAYAVSATMILTFLNASGSVVGTDTYSGIAPASVAWEYFYKTARAPATATKFKLHCQLDSTTSGGFGGGLLWDELEVFDASIARQDRWHLTQFKSGIDQGGVLSGGAAVLSQNWLWPDAYQGGYSVFLAVTASDSDTGDVVLGMTGGGRPDVQANQQVRFGAWFKTPPGVSTNPKVYLDVQGYKSDGTKTGARSRTTINAGAGFLGWTFYSVVHTFPSDAVKGEFLIRFRSSGAVLVDALAARDNAGWDGNAAHFFIPDGPLQLTLTAASLFAGSSDPAEIAAAGSAALYGERTETASQSSLTTLADAQTYARGVFLDRALPPLSPSVELVDDLRPFRTGQNVALIGRDGAALGQGKALPIVQIESRWDGRFTQRLDLERPFPDPGARILEEIDKRLRMGNVNQGGGPTSSSVGSAGSTSGNGGGGGAFWGTGPRTPDDATLHDDYAPADGPHVLASERTAWDGTTAEVTTARNAYPSLDTRLDAMDTATGTAQATGNTAQTAANTAQTTANSAQTTANTALHMNPGWGLSGVDGSSGTGGAAAFAPAGITPTWSSVFSTPDGNLDFTTGTGTHFDPIAHEQRVIFATRLKVAAATTVSIRVSADNAARILLNGVQVGADCNSGTYTVYDLALSVGWNLLQICFQNGDGDTYQLTVTGWASSAAVPLAGLVDRMAPALTPGTPGAPGAAPAMPFKQGARQGYTTLTAGTRVALATFTLPAGSLASDGDTLRVRLSGQANQPGTSAIGQWDIRFGSTVISTVYDTAYSSVYGMMWEVEFLVTRASVAGGSSSVQCLAKLGTVHALSSATAANAATQSIGQVGNYQTPALGSAQTVTVGYAVSTVASGAAVYCFAATAELLK